MKNNTLGIYIHIPFCVRKCAYCDFLSAPPENEQAMHDYVESLCREIVLKNMVYAKPTDLTYGTAFGASADCEGKSGGKCIVDTIFFGGGTPSLLCTEDFNKIMDTLKACFRIASDAEITVECNPDTVDFDKFCNYIRQGVNRISFGLQSACNEELKMLGRIHNYERFLESFHAARRAGFMNVNVDLISAIPGQTPAGWEKTLRKVAELEPEHISAYSLILEEGTSLFRQQDSYKFPTEDEDLEMYEATERILSEYGFKRYEISNYAKEGRESRHNNRYWQRKAYLGFGVGAASFVDNKRFSNISDVDKYCLISDADEYTDECEELTIDECMAEFFYLGLRRMAGVYFKDFEEEFNMSALEVYGEVIGKLVEQGLLEYITESWESKCDKAVHVEAVGHRENDSDAAGRVIGVKLSNKGIFLSNRVFMEFV